MIRVEKLERGTYFDDAYKISFRYDPVTVNKVKELAQRRYLPEDKAWEIPNYELPNLIDKVGLDSIDAEDAIIGALKAKEIEDRRKATAERLKGIRPLTDFEFTTEPLPHQIEAFNFGLQRNMMLIGDEQGLGKTKESNSWQYGEEYTNLIGNSYDEDYLYSEVKRYIEECLLINEHITGIAELEVEQVKDKLHISFTLVTDVGSKEMMINV